MLLIKNMQNNRLWQLHFRIAHAQLDLMQDKFRMWVFTISRKAKTAAFFRGQKFFLWYMEANIKTRKSFNTVTSWTSLDHIQMEKKPKVHASVG